MPRPIRLLLAAVLIYVYAALPSRVSGRAASMYLSGFPLLKQQHPLTCESSAVSMGTRARVTEAQLMRAMPRNPNPNLGFRGNPDGQQGTTLVNYGVYAAPLHQALLRYNFGSQVLSYGTDEALRLSIDRGWPVVTWITYNLQRAVPRLAWSNGTQFFLVPFEHAVLMVGYDASSVTVLDPWVPSRKRFTWTQFNRAWGYFGRMALAIEPCALPSPVSLIRPTFGADSSLTWIWQPGANDSSFHVKVLRHAATDRTVFDGTMNGNRFTLSAADRGVSYEIAVTGLSACGGLSGTRRLWTFVALPLPTPTAVEATVSATPLTPSGTLVPSPTVTPTVK